MRRLSIYEPGIESRNPSSGQVRSDLGRWRRIGIRLQLRGICRPQQRIPKCISQGICLAGATGIGAIRRPRGHRQRARRRPQLRRANAATDLACAGYCGIDPRRTGLCRGQSAALPEGHSGLLGRATADIDRGGLSASPHRNKPHSSVSSRRATPVAVASGPGSFRLRAGETSSGRDGQVFISRHWRFRLKPHACSKSRKCRVLQGF